MTRVKICGLRSAEDALAAAAAGADAIGLNFHPASPRVVDAARAREICAALPPFVTSVGLFVDATADEIAEVLATVPLQMLQFHGDETEAECLRWGLPYLKALRVHPELDLARVLTGHGSAAAMLLDTYRPGVPGGTGSRFDWDLIPRDPGRPVVLAGGLDADNVARAIEQVRPWAVDVSGGVERASGVKDSEAIRRFVRAVRESTLGAGS